MNEPAKTNPHHSSASNEHGTPPEIVASARETLGGIDLDPATDRVFNRVVRATRIFTREQDGFRQAWRGRIFLNPPGGMVDSEGRTVLAKCRETGACGLPPGHEHAGTESNQKRWWAKLARRWKRGDVHSAIFVAFSIELLQTTQDLEDAPIPLDFPFCIPAARPRYRKQVARKEGPGLDLEAQTSPTHAGAVVFLPPLRLVDERYLRLVDERRFRAAFSPVGRCANFATPLRELSP
jgi:hypothetical protein